MRKTIDPNDVKGLEPVNVNPLYVNDELYNRTRSDIHPQHELLLNETQNKKQKESYIKIKEYLFNRYNM